MSEKTATPQVEEMFEAGAHFGYSKSRRHPSVKPYIFGAKNNTEIIDLEKTQDMLETAKTYVAELSLKGKTIWFVGTKPEARKSVTEAAESVNQPYVTQRWIGGMITNYAQMRKRINRLSDLVEQKEKGELSVYTKKEQLLIDREIEQLQKDFGGVAHTSQLPEALFIVDPRKEYIAVAEAKDRNIPIIALASSDCNIAHVDYPILANDATMPSITYFVEHIADAIKNGQKNQQPATENTQ